jgi:hypothetical protein
VRLKATGGVQFLRKISAGRVAFLIVSYWESYDAIRKFVGEDIDQPVYYPEDKEYLLGFEPKVGYGTDVCSLSRGQKPAIF